MSRLSLEEMVGQTLNLGLWANARPERPEQLGEVLERCPAGGIFLGHAPGEDYRAVWRAARGACRVPPILNADLVFGAGAAIEDQTRFPQLLALGAAGDPGLAEAMGVATAREGRSCGCAWNLGPVVDLCLNPVNPMMNIRTLGADPERVLELALAVIRGLQQDGRMAACAKHFPGDGTDDRDSHVCTALNHLDRERWMETYGRVWRGVIEAGVMTIMSGHIGLPFLDPGRDYLGPKPATLSRKIQEDLLRGELGFEGLIVSDAMPMVGFCVHAAARDRAWMNIASGSDSYLWAKPADFGYMMEAVRRGDLSEERVAQACRRNLELKARVGLLDDPDLPPAPDESERASFRRAALTIAERSVTLIRDEHGRIPLRLHPGDRILTVTVNLTEGLRGKNFDMTEIDQALRERGYEVDHVYNLAGGKIAEVAGQYAAILVNLAIRPRYGTNKLFPPAANVFWGAFWMDHPQVVFCNLGDPFKLYELPFLPNYVCTWNDSADSQRALVECLLGERAFQGGRPVRLEGFWEMDPAGPARS